MVRALINAPAIANVMGEGVVDSYSLCRDERLNTIKEAFPNGEALLYRDLDGLYMAVSPVVEGLWIRGLPRRCFSPFTDFDAVPDFDWRMEELTMVGR